MKRALFAFAFLILLAPWMWSQSGPESAIRKVLQKQAEDWNRGERVDYRTYHLPPPRSGYEWREVDGNYVMAAVATGIIASTIVAATH